MPAANGFLQGPARGILAVMPQDFRDVDPRELRKLRRSYAGEPKIGDFLP